MGSVMKKIDRNGRLVLPYTMRNAVGLGLNQEAQIELSGSMLIVTAPSQAGRSHRTRAAVSPSLLACLEGLDDQKVTLIMNIANGLKAL